MSVDMNAVSETRTICEILREIHDIAIERGLDDIAYLTICESIEEEGEK